MNDKDQIRHKLKIKRRYFAEIRREYADMCIRENFMLAYGGYESFFIYNSYGTEASTKLIIAELLKAGKKVYLPRVEGESIVAVPFGEMQKSVLGIDEPEGQAYKGDIDVTVIPLLAVNKRGFRIGYGGGFYDRYLKNAKTEKVGLGYFFQIDDFKEDEWDIPLDAYLCEKGVYDFGE